jgi:hypothetical protein
MTVLQAMQHASMALMGYSPSTFFGSSEQFEQEITSLVNEAAIDIARNTDWQSLIKIANFAGDGVSESFDLPEDYDRMTVTAEVQDLQNWVWGYFRAKDLNEFMWMKARGWNAYPGIWIIYDDKLQVYPAPGVGQSASFPYITNNTVKGELGQEKKGFNQDSDTFRIRDGERLLKLWLIWRWRENKKYDSTGDQENFVKAIDELSAKDQGARVIRRNSRRNWGNTRAAWPWQLG